MDGLAHGQAGAQTGQRVDGLQAPMLARVRTRVPESGRLHSTEWHFVWL